MVIPVEISRLVLVAVQGHRGLGETGVEELSMFHVTQRSRVRYRNKEQADKFRDIWNWSSPENEQAMTVELAGGFAIVMINNPEMFIVADM
jgi:hypothetical protein